MTKIRFDWKIGFSEIFTASTVGVIPFFDPV